MVVKGIYSNRWWQGGWTTDLDSKEICGCGVFLGRSDSRGNTCRQLVRSCRCTAAHRGMQHTHPRLWREREGWREGGLLSEKRDTTVITREQDNQPPSFTKFYTHRWEQSSLTGRQLEDILDMSQWKKQRCTVLHSKTLADCCAQCHGRLGQFKEELFLVSLLWQVKKHDWSHCLLHVFTAPCWITQLCGVQ